MSFRTSPPGVSSSFDLVRRSFLQSSQLPCSGVLTAEHIQQAFEAEQVSFGGSGKQPIWTMPVTLWAMISQALYTGAERSCRSAVIRVAIYFAQLGQVISTNTGNYCRARGRVGEGVVRRLTEGAAERSDQSVPESWKWLGMTVRMVDGTDISLPDTPENQQAYPQSSSQKPGLGFPMMRVVALISLATGMVSGMACGPLAGKETGETALLRSLFSNLKAGEVLLGDRYYSGWFMLALLQQRGIRFVVRMHHLRDYDFSRGRRLGKKDHVVMWTKPPRPEWLNQETYDNLPDNLEVRETYVSVSTPGFRPESIIVASSFLDTDEVGCGDLAQLYRSRWRAELHLREIKTYMELDILRAKTPEMARQELWTGLLTYNLIRHSLMQSALEADKLPSQLSFTATVQLLSGAWLINALPLGMTWNHDILTILRIVIGASHIVGNRPDRVEPRAIKRRPSAHDLLMISRAEAIAKLINV